MDNKRPILTVSGNPLRASTTENSLIPFIGYLALFFFAWTFGWVGGVYPWATRTIGDATLLYALISIVFRLVIWVLPVIGYLRYIDRVDVWEYLQLKRHWRRGIVVGLTLTAINFLGTMARLGPPAWTSAHVTWNSILGTSILVGVFEEIPFRGFILQKLQQRFDFVTSMVVSSTLFVGAHVPGWILLGSLTAGRIAYIFVFGAVMAIVLRYSESLWAPIVTHSLNDALSYVISTSSVADDDEGVDARYVTTTSNVQVMPPQRRAPSADTNDDPSRSPSAV